MIFYIELTNFLNHLLIQEEFEMIIEKIEERNYSL